MNNDTYFPPQTEQFQELPPQQGHEFHKIPLLNRSEQPPIDGRRKVPNILITGNPGTGKSTLVENLLQRLPKLRAYNVSKISLNNKMTDGFDDDRDTTIIDEDAICDYLESEGMGSFGQNDGGMIVEYHSSDFFAERYFDIIIVLRCDIKELNKRLFERNYSEKKVRENVDCEIFQQAFQEADASYPKAQVFHYDHSELSSMFAVVEHVEAMINNWPNPPPPFMP